MLRKLQLAAMLYLDQRRLKREIMESNLSELKTAPPAIEGHLWESQEVWAPLAQKLNDELIGAFVSKTMLLVTGLSDVVKILGTTNHPVIRNSLIKAYAARTKDLGSIIELLNRLWENAEASASNNMLYDLHATEDFLTARGQQLIAETGHALSFGITKMLAAQVDSATGEETASRAAEDLVISLAIPKVERNVRAAVKLAEAFRIQPGTHRFLLAFLNAYGITNRHQAEKIANNIVSPYYHGDKVAEKLLDLAHEGEIELGSSLRRKLRTLSKGKSTGFTGILDDDGLGELLSEVFDGLFGGATGKFGMAGGVSFERYGLGLPGMGLAFGGPFDGPMSMGDDRHHVQQGMPFDGMLGDLMAGMMGGMPSSRRGGFHFDDGDATSHDLRSLEELLSSLMGENDHSSHVSFPPHAFLRGETHNHPSMAANKCATCPGLPRCPDRKAQAAREAMGMPRAMGGQGRRIDITGSDEEKLQQLEEHLQRICAEGTIDMTVINDMPAELFMMLNLNMFSPETQAIIKDAVLNKQQLH